MIMIIIMIMMIIMIMIMMRITCWARALRRQQSSRHQDNIVMWWMTGNSECRVCICINKILLKIRQMSRECRK